MKLTFRVFRSQGFSDTQVEPTAELAAAFASKVGRDNLVSMTHAFAGIVHIVTVWYWAS